jgi:putative two-component system response regulator
MRMSRYSALIAEKLDLPAKEVKNILYASPMHDIGKIGIPDSILMKPGKLTEEEFGIMKTHSIIGANLLAYSKSEILQVAEQIAISHHEKWNGKGYPQGLSGDNIPLSGRIVCLADAFDALISKRPYKDPYPIETAADIIKKERGEHFDPDIVDVFLENIDEILKIKDEVNSTEDLTLSDVSYVARGIGQKDNDQA